MEFSATPLQMAARFGSPEALQELLKAGANPNAQNPDYGAALPMAAEAKVPDRYGFLTANKAKNSNYVECIKMLVAAGADVNARNYAGSTASDIVLKHGDSAFMEPALLALKVQKPTDKIAKVANVIQHTASLQDGINGIQHVLTEQDLPSKQVAAILGSMNAKNLSSLSMLLRSSDPDVRTRALEVIDDVALGKPSSLPNERDDMDMDMCLCAIEGHSHAPALLDRKLFGSPLISCIFDVANDPEPRVRAACINALSIITPAGSDIVDVVKNKLVSDPDYGVRLRCVETLGRFAATQRRDLSSEIEKLMQSATAHDADCPVRLGAAIILQFIHGQMNSQGKHTHPKPLGSIILAQEFGIIKEPSQIKTQIDTRKIPCHKGVFYGVCVVPDDYDSPPNLKVRLTMPFARRHWPENMVSGGEHIEVSTDRRVGTYKMAGGSSYYSAVSWTVDEEDKPGKYKAEVLVNNRVTKTFDFELVASQ